MDQIKFRSQNLEKYASYKNFKSTSFITVIRDNNHPQKPIGYKSPLNVWQRLGYTKSGSIVTYDWPTRQSENPNIFKEQPNPCDIWIKKLPLGA